MINWILGNNVDINNYQDSLKSIPDLERSLSREHSRESILERAHNDGQLIGDNFGKNRIGTNDSEESSD